MARRGNVFGVVVKVAKAIDKANKQAIKDAHRIRNQALKEEARQDRELLKAQKDRERAQKAYEKQVLVEQKYREIELEKRTKENQRRQAQAQKSAIDAKKKTFKDQLENAAQEYAKRCSDRENLRHQFIERILR